MSLWPKGQCRKDAGYIQNFVSQCQRMLFSEEENTSAYNKIDLIHWFYFIWTIILHNDSNVLVCLCMCRDFVENHYVSLKRANPEFPILIRECSGVQARLWGRYGEGLSLTLAPSLFLFVSVCFSLCLGVSFCLYHCLSLSLCTCLCLCLCVVVLPAYEVVMLYSLFWFTPAGFLRLWMEVASCVHQLCSTFNG